MTRSCWPTWRAWWATRSRTWRPCRLRDQLLEKVWPWWGDLLGHPDRDQYWQDLSVIDHAEDLTVPALHIGGWFDIFVSNTARSFTELKARSGSAEAREGQRLIIGPWDHLNSTGIYPDRQFGMMGDALTQDLTGQHLKFFDRWLKQAGGAGRLGPGPDLRHGHRPVARRAGLAAARHRVRVLLPAQLRPGQHRRRRRRARHRRPRPRRPPTPTSTTRAGPCPPWAGG